MEDTLLVKGGGALAGAPDVTFRWTPERQAPGKRHRCCRERGSEGSRKGSVPTGLRRGGCPTNSMDSVSLPPLSHRLSVMKGLGLTSGCLGPGEASKCTVKAESALCLRP